MKKILAFIDTWAIRIMFPLVIIVFFKTCSTNSKIEKNRKNIARVDSLVSVSKSDFNNMLKAEGLKAEKRMIQSTDRKIMDVNRQSEIDRELEKLGIK